jgi:hypothetical protein
LKLQRDKNLISEENNENDKIKQKKLNSSFHNIIENNSDNNKYKKHLQFNIGIEEKGNNINSKNNNNNNNFEDRVVGNKNIEKV